MRQEITPRQEQVLQAIAHFWRQGRAPTTGELLQELNLATISGLDDLLRPLRDKGYLSWNRGVRGRQRLLKLTSKGRALTKLGIPVLGEIPAGPLQEAIQQSDEWLEGLAGLLQWGPEDYLLRVKGDSMIEAHILPGDYVQLRPQVQVQSGEIAAVQICDEGSGIAEATLKYLDFVAGQDKVVLRAANPAYAPREVEVSCIQVVGVLRGVLRVSR